MFNVGIITAPRKPPYIGTMLANYFEHWEQRPFVFAEPGCKSFLGRNKVEFIQHTEKLGVVRNWLQSIKHLHSVATHPFYMMLEDDIEFVPGVRPAVEKLLAVVPNDLGYISCYCSQVNRPKRYGWNVPRIGYNGLCGALCVILPKASVELLLEREDFFLQLSKDKDTEPKHLDFAIGEFFKAKSNFIHNPTMVLHRGDVSTATGNNEPRNAGHPCRQPAL